MSMVDYTSTLQKLRDIDGKVNNLNNLDELNNIISRRATDLYSVLSSNNFFINEDVDREINNLTTRLSIGGPLVVEAQGEIIRLVAERTALPVGATSNTRRSEIGRDIGKLLRITGGTEGAPGNGSTTRVNDRYNDYNNIKIAKDTFNISNILPDAVHTLGTANNYANLNSAANFNCTPTNGFHFFDENGNRINALGGKYKFKMKMIDGSESEVEVEGISIVGNNITFTHNVKFTPSNVDFNKPLEVNIGGVYENVGAIGVNVIHVKKLKINITNPDFLSLQPIRNTEFDNYNVYGGGSKIKDHLDTRNKLDLNKLERQSIERAVKDGDGPKYEQLSEGQKEQFYQQIRQLNHPVAGTPFFSHLESVGNFNDYNSFRGWFTHKDRDWNKGDNISSKAKYRDFIHNNLEPKSTEYISSQLDDEILKKHDINTFVKSELTKYLDEIEKNKVDSDIHSDIDSDLRADKHEMKKGPRSMITPRDKNYMRFFSGSSISLENQKVNIDTNTSAEAVDKPTPVTYKMDLEVGSTNRTSVSIDIEGERKPIQVKAGDPTSLVRSIMKNQKIPHGKVRAHIAFNIYKAMIQMAKSKDISLNYRNNGNNHLNEIDLDKDGNIVVYDLDDWTNRSTNTKRITKVLFDQKMFNNTNDFDKAGYNGSLRSGIEDISSHFNLAMNGVHKQYRKATKKRLRGMISSPSRPKLPSSIWLSPIKKMMNMGTNTNFDFDINIESNGNKIGVKFEKNKYIVTAEGLDKPIESRDLGKILNKRKQRKRIFDGMERDIVEGVYSVMIEKLRTNSKIARSNFGVTDDITGNMYILDSDGEFGMVTKEKLDLKDGNPLGRKSKKKGMIKTSRLLTSGYEKLDESETKELLKNPFLMQKMMKVMNRRMGFGASMKAIFVK